MTRLVKPVLYASALAMLAVHCGGSSTPESNTPSQSQGQSDMQGQSAAGEPPGTSDPAGTGETGTMGTASGESAGQWSTEDRMPTAGRDETGSGDTAAAAGESGATALTDGQVAMITELANTSEIEQAKLAQTKSKNPRVLNFAQMMIQHHGQAKQQQSALGLSTAPSPMSRMLDEQGRKTMATLQDKTGSDFDRAYMEAQVEQHQKVLDAIDQKLLPNAKNAQLRQQLQSMRPTVQQHLQSAREIQQALSQGASRSGTTGGSQSGSSGGSTTGSGNKSGAGGQ